MDKIDIFLLDVEKKFCSNSAGRLVRSGVGKGEVEIG